MKKFRFRLETLLNFRKMHEEKAQMKLAEAANCLRKEQELLNLFQFQLLSNLELLGLEHSGGNPTVETLKLFSDYVDKIKRKITDQQQIMAKAALYRDECLAELEHAIKQRKLVDNLKEKQLEHYHYDFLQEEQKILDELGTQAYMRGKESSRT